jgi:hypothetical protein
MADEPGVPEPNGEAPTPKWVYYAVGIVVILVALLIGGMHLSGGITPPHLAPQ